MTQYQLRTGTAPSGNPHAYGDVDKIRALLDATDADAIAKAGEAHKAASEHLARLRDVLAHAARTLTDVWDDEAATATQAALKKLHTTADELSTATAKVGGTLDWYGAEILPWYVKHKPGAGWIKTGGDDDYAREYMKRLNGRITEAWSRLPESVMVQKGLRIVDDLQPTGAPPHPMDRAAASGQPTQAAPGISGGSHGGREPAGASGAPGSLSGPHGGGGVGSSPPGQHPVGVFPHDTELAGVGGSTGMGSPFSGPPGGFGSGGAPGTFGGPGSAVIGGPSGLPPTPGGAPGSLGPPDGGAGMPPNAGSAGARTTLGRQASTGLRGTGPMGSGGMGAGGKGEAQEERRRDYWLAEDKESWEGEPAVTPVIGAELSAVIESDEDGWRMDSATEVWGMEPVPEPNVGGAPSAPRGEQEEEFSQSSTKCSCGCGKAADERPGRLDAPPELRGDG
ncbi:WXG100 family type VII secretion target [Actinomadura atramentaria]|uniref:WXG100 family type VII secretion target n=1 Tax=Actinomadura atramentaria TaxID=1990 RepID=UPI0012FB3850|nr:hypothetical protein [Actinomadura atramentaria]